MEDVLFSESEHLPDFKIWDSLSAFKLTQDQCKEIEMIPLDSYFELPENSAAFGTINMLFDSIRPEGHRTCLKRVAFKYLTNKNGVTYLFIMCMTDKGTRRHRDTPFVFQCILKCSKDSPEVETTSRFEGKDANSCLK